jgi:hypothetical protein
VLSDYAELKRTVEDAGFFTTPMPLDNGGDRLALASMWHRRGLTGNSFWVAKRGTNWYLGTWGSHLYRVPNDADLADLCLTWLRATDETMSDIDNALKVQYGLVELTDEQAESALEEPTG